MDFLKGFGAFILGFLLFISLSVFGLVLLLNSTVLDPDFIKKQVDGLDISAMTRDIAGDEIKNSLPPEMDFIEESVYAVIDSQEAEIKNLAGQAIDSAYDYLLGDTADFSISISLVKLKTDLRESLWREFEDHAVVWILDNYRDELESYIYENLSVYRQLLPSELAAYSDAQLESYIDTFLDQSEAQVAILGKVPVLSGLLGTLARPYFDEYYDEFIAEIPDVWTADESDIPDDVMDGLVLARRYIGYFNWGLYCLVAFMVLLAGGIFLIYRNVPGPSLALGIDLALFGLLNLAGALVARNVLPSDYMMDIPQSIHDWLAALYRDAVMVLVPFSIVVLVIGIALIAVSFVFKRKGAGV